MIAIFPTVSLFYYPWRSNMSSFLSPRTVTAPKQEAHSSRSSRRHSSAQIIIRVTGASLFSLCSLQAGKLGFKFGNKQGPTGDLRKSPEIAFSPLKKEPGRHHCHPAAGKRSAFLISISSQTRNKNDRTFTALLVDITLIQKKALGPFMG